MSQFAVKTRVAAAYYVARVVRPERPQLWLAKRRDPDLSIYEPTRRFYAEVYGESVTPEQAHRRALNKQRHKDLWDTAARTDILSIRQFYQEADVYPFRQPLNWRYRCTQWYLDLIRHLPDSPVLEYGCGSAVLTQKLSERGSKHTFVVADIPSRTLEFVRWKHAAGILRADILEIGEGREGVPLDRKFGLIICQDVLEHTPNPLEIVEEFAEHLLPKGVLYVDFLNAPGGENLEQSVAQRDRVIEFLDHRLTPIKKIDALGRNDGVYIHL